MFCASVLQAAAPGSVPVTLRTKVSRQEISVPLALSYQQVVLERRTGSGWKPIGVQYPRSLNREKMRNISFTLPAGVSPDEVRVQGYRTPKFPARFVYGKRQFVRSEATSEMASSGSMDRLKEMPKENVLTPAVAEMTGPDLWQIEANQLFYFNQYRGLQILDLSDPTNPLRTGVLRLPLVGQRMFVLDPAATQLALLGRSIDKKHLGATTIALIRMTDGVPTLVGDVPVDGLFVDCLMIGTKLHLLSTKKDAVSGVKTFLTGIELTNLEKPEALEKLSFIGGQPYFQREGNRLLVGVKDAGQTRVHEVKVEGISEATIPPSQDEKPSIVMGYEVSVSGQKLRVKHAQDVQDPSVEMALTWRVDRVLPVGDFLVQVEDGGGYHLVSSSLGEDAGLTEDVKLARLRISPANDPDLLVGEFVLGSGKVVSLSQKGEMLFVAQWVPESGGKQALLRTWALSLSDPTSVVEVGHVEQDLRGLDAWDLDLEAVQPLWVDKEILVWYLPAQHHPDLWWSGPVEVKSLEKKGAALLPGRSVVMVLCPVHFSKGTLREDESQVLRIQGQVVDTSKAMVEEGLVYFSHDMVDPSLGLQMPLRPRPNQMHSWLQVVDFRSGAPVLRDPVSIPGQLLNVSQADAQGAVLLTQTDLILKKDADAARVIQACAYDGVNAYLLDTYVTATSFQSAAAAEGDCLYLTQDKGKAGVVAVGYQKEAGRLGQISSWTTNAPPQLLHVTAGHLLASSLGNLEVASIQSDTGKLSAIASYDTPATLQLKVDRSTVTPTLGLWIPAGRYGVEFLQKQAIEP